MLKKSKFCICFSGYEVVSFRIVEVIYVDCVFVFIFDVYVVFFSDVFNWKVFFI